MNLLLAGLFAVLGGGCMPAAMTGYRGWVCDARRGYKVPTHVQRSPELRERANMLVRFWCTGVAILSAAPLVPLLTSARDEPLSTAALVVLAVYGFLIVCAASRPFEKIKQLRSD